MVLEMPTASSNSYPTKRVTESGQKFQKTSQISCDRERLYQIPKPLVLYSEKGLFGRKIYSRSINTKQMYQMPIFQNVDYESDSVTTTKTILDNFARSERRILAHQDHTTKTTLSRFSLQRPKLALQGPALWPQYRPPLFHETDSSHSQGNGVTRHMVPTIFGRPPYYQFNERGMLTPCKNSNVHPEKLRLDPEHKEISVGTSTNIRLARSTLQPHQPHGTVDKRKNRVAPKANNFDSNFKILLKTNNNENTRTSQLDRSIRPTNTSFSVKNKSFTKILQKTKDRCKDSPNSRNETKPNQMGLLTNGFATTRKSNPKLHNSNRCLIKRLGISNQSKILQGRLRSHGKVFDQHLGITDGLVCTTENKRQTRGDPNIMRQLHGSGGSQTLYVPSVPHSNDIRDHLETSNNPRLEPFNISYRRSFQCSGRSAIQEHHPVNRMVIAPQRFSTIYTQGEPGPSNRPFCNQLKSQIKEIHLSLPRPNGDSSGYNDSRLGEVGTPLSVSPCQHDFEGFSETTTDKFQNSYTSNTRDTNTTMVHGVTTTENTIEVDSDTASTNSVNQIDESNQTFHTSRLEVIKAAYNKQFPGCNAAVNLMAAPLRKNSIKDYQHKWKSFLSYLNDRKTPFDKVTIASVLRFLTFLFHKKHFKPGTVAHYRTALTVPLKEYFNIDLKVPAVADLLRGMWLQRPNIPSSAPAWSLNKVLSYLENLADPLGETMLFRKTAFLLLLSTGWRVSELHACVRNEEFCRFSENSSLHIRPHPSFLAKNENPQKRWVHKEIKVLKLEDGSISKLCPVTSLKQYLRYSSNKISGDLLLTPGNHKKKLSIHLLSTQICSLILQADETTDSNVHDIRKYATSCALAETMLVGDLVSEINWSSPATFYKFYLTQTEPLTRPVSLPVQRRLT